MKLVDAAVSTAIREDYNLTALPRLTVEWNYNRFVDDVVADNNPSDDLEGYDVELYPVDSIIAPNRPTAGILKARVNQSKVSDPYSAWNGEGRYGRYYLASVDSIYKYWTSPITTDSNGDFLQVSGVDMVKPFVAYGQTVKANKIVIGFEDTWAKPENFTVRTRGIDGTTWTTVATNPTINSKGQVILYYNGTGWSSTKPAVMTNLVEITGVQTIVTSLQNGLEGTGANASLSLIEISARREDDLSDRLITVSDTFDMSERSLVYPIGTLTSNVATVQLYNGDGVFNPEAPGSDYEGLLEPNVVFNLEYIYHINGEEYPVQQFKMYGDAWKGLRSENVEIELTDFSKHFQEIKPRAAMYQNLSVAEIIWRICDSVGFVDYVIDLEDTNTEHKIPIWWTNGEKTVWELFDELAKATQTAIYFDGFGKLQVRTRTAAFNPNRSVSWTLRGENSGSELADIVTLEQTDELESNSVIINYTTTEFDPEVNGQAKTQVLWEPDGTVALRACPLFKNLGTTDTYLTIPPAEAKIWLYEGVVNIEGEFIKYKGKQFVYYTGLTGATRNVVDTFSKDEMEKFNTLTPTEYRHKNGFTGALKIAERGVWNSEVRAHNVEATGYSVRNITNGNHHTSVPGFKQYPAESRVHLSASPKFKRAADLLIATRGATVDSGFFHYGTKLRFEKGRRKNQRAGIVLHNNTNNEDGYYIELVPSKILNKGKERAARNELIFYTRKGGEDKRIGGKGTPLAILEGREYEIDVYYSAPGGNHRIQIWIDGRTAMTVTISGADKNNVNGKFGMFLRGDTHVSYEYLYGIAYDEVQPPDDFSFLDKVEGGYTGGQWDREWVYDWRTKTRKKKKKQTKQVNYKANKLFFDEFGPIVHEVREYNVKFDPAPALTARIYMANDYSAICPEFRADAFGAYFYLANTSRQTAIVHGEDTLKVGGSSSSVNLILTVIGRAITVAEAEKVTVQNEEQIRKRGRIETELNSPWIQNKSLAEDLGEWIKDHWSIGADEQAVQVFGNPLFEPGDLVAVSYVQRDMATSTHKYFVVSVSTVFDSGIKTDLILRRAV